uniref:NACHT domain-containing protein n=1 Tax=Daphnia galeata TaxID=27404 RepID=A0A8J2RSY0_9CRUS|nr:unnamed protein product [Daphnia galeata]
MEPTNFNSETDNSPASVGLKKTLHGNVFQLKLLMLFLIRGIAAGYQFQLGSEMPEVGGKFEDLIFKFKDETTSNEKQIKSYQFLQAKHTQNEEQEKITATEILNDNEGDFSLPKYFRSYFRDIIQGSKGCLVENVHDCIICTNIGFENENDLRKGGIELIRLDNDDKILSFDNEVSARYKLKKTVQLCQKFAGWSEIHFLAKTLLEYATQNKKLTLKKDVFKSYHSVLVKEKVIDRERQPSGKLNKDFLDGTNLIGNVKEFRQILSDFTFEKMKNRETEDSAEQRKSVFETFWRDTSFQLSKDFGTKSQSPDETKKSLDCAIRDEDITSFLDKLVFAVHTPNEVKLDSILKSEVGKYYELYENDFQSDFILRKMLDWLKKKESTFITSEEGKKIFEEGEKKMESLRVTAISIDYQKQLKEALKFNVEAIGKMKKKLMQLLTSPNRIGRITTPLPKRTAVKVIGALEKFKSEERKTTTNNQIPKNYFQYEDSYLVTSLSRLQKEIELQKDSNSLAEGSKFVETLHSEHSHHLLIVVCEDGPSKETDEFCQKLLKKMPKKRVIIISQVKGEVVDELNFSDLSENSQRVLLEKEIKFQGSLQSVGDLIERRDTTLDGLIKNGDAENIFDFNSIEELIAGKPIEISSGSSAHFEQNLYIERQLEFPFANFNDFYDRLAKSLKCTKEKLLNEFVIDSQGNIEWFVEDDGEKKICGKTEKKKVKEKENENSINSPSANDDATPEEEVTNTNENRKGRVVKKSRKQEIWEEMKKIVNENSGNSPSSNADPKKDLITNEKSKGKVFILDGIAGTGKSTILSNYYEGIKKKHPDTWVIRIDLLDYSKELQFSPINQGSAIKFFVDIFAKNSPFARSLLTHRFETDGGIVVMLDGYDEIGDEKREKVLQLVTAIKLTNVDALYLTTRSHFKKDLQDKLFQFSYTLKKFSDENQVDCLSKYWTSKLEMQDEIQEKSIQSFGETLVTRLSTTLKDKEKDFIGIPLQCRMLAEIYETQLIDTIRQGLSIDSLIQDISTTDLDLTSLYSLFMEKKFEIYVSQKLKTDNSNDPLNSNIEHTKDGLEEYLRKLAIKTIVFYSDDVDVLVGKSKSFVSCNKMRQEEKRLTDLGVRCGFLGKDDKGEKKFLHRTYAEYLFAKYLHVGFLPEEDEDCNQLLTSQPVRELIFRTILLDEQFEGMRVFFNSMINKKAEPTAHLSREIEKYNRILVVAIRDQNANLFTFLCDCLNMSLEKVEIQTILHHNARLEYKQYRKTFMYNMCVQNSKVFERFISYYEVENADKEAVEFILHQMFHIDLKNVSESEPNQEEMTKIIERVIRFFDRNRETTKKFLNNTGGRKIHPDLIDNPGFIVNALLFNECYSSNLKSFLELLSSVYCEDTEFEIFLLETIEEYKHDISRGNLEKTLTVLRDLERNEVLEGISCQIFRMDVQLFKRFYQPKKEARADEDVLLTTNAISIAIFIYQSLLVRDSHQMTRLHRAALHGDEETVGQILEMVGIFCSSPETQKMGMKVLHKVFVIEKDDEEDEDEEEEEEDEEEEEEEDEEDKYGIPLIKNQDITPLYVAAACEHENIFKQMLEFLRDVLPKDKLTYYVTKQNGFLSYALWDAIKWRKVEMFRFILKSVKETLGQYYLIELMKENRDCWRDKKIFFEVIVKVIDGENGYKELNDLLFSNYMKIKQFKYIDKYTLQKMLSVGEMDAWIKRLLDTNFREGFVLVIRHLLKKLTDEQRPQLLRLIISVNSDQKSYWGRWEDEFVFCYSERIDSKRVSSLMRFMQCVSDNLSQSEIKELLTRNNNRIIKVALSRGGKMLSLLSNEKGAISIQDLTNIVSKLIEGVNGKLKYVTDIRGGGGFREGMRNILDFYFNYVEKFDLSKLVEAISCNYTGRDGDNIWSIYLKKPITMPVHYGFSVCFQQVLIIS